MLQILLLLSFAGSGPAEFKAVAPEFARVTRWVNSKPLKLTELRGKVIVVHFFAFG